MLDDLAGKRTGERIQILRERKGLSRPVLAGLVGMSASWLKGIEQGRRLPPRLPVLVKLAEALAVGDVAVLAGTDMDLGGAASVPVASFARIPHDAVPAIRDAVRDPMLSAPGSGADVESLAARTADAWRLWHTSREHRTEVGRILPRLVTDARAAARSVEGADRRTANAVLAEVYALVQHEIVWASEAELIWTVADRAMIAAQEADTPVALAGAAWTLGMVQRSAGDVNGALSLARDAVGLLEPLMDDGDQDVPGLAGALELHAATTCAKAGREGMPGGTGTGLVSSPVGCPVATTIRGRCSDRRTWTCMRCRSARTWPSRRRHAAARSRSTLKAFQAGNAVVGWAWRSLGPTASDRTTRACCTGWNWPTRPRPTRCATPPRPGNWPRKPSITAVR